MVKSILLRDITEQDFPVLYEFQLDPEANHMAAYPAKNRKEFIDHCREKIFNDDSVIAKGIIFNNHLVGNVVSWEISGERVIGYWIDKKHWGNGIATMAVSALLDILKMRPVLAYVARHILASIRVLEKCGFRQANKLKSLPDIADEELEEYILNKLGAVLDN